MKEKTIELINEVEEISQEAFSFYNTNGEGSIGLFNRYREVKEDLYRHIADEYGRESDEYDKVMEVFTALPGFNTGNSIKSYDIDDLRKDLAGEN